MPQLTLVVEFVLSGRYGMQSFLFAYFFIE